ncbi:MAG: ABC transporter substrate-binding protein [Devosia sp.]|nr:ABC transporter substrate-binding protein [Devosia sp.]
MAASALWVGAAEVQAATPRDALVMAWNLDALITFDPAQIAEVNGNDIIRNVCEPLVNYDRGDVSKLVPSSAESWTVSDDGLTLTFKLRANLKFPSGKTATAHDAVWSMHRVVGLGYGNSANFTQWGFTKDKIEQQITAADDRTIVVKMDRPYPVGLILSAMFASGSTGILDSEEGKKAAKTVDGRYDWGNPVFKTNPTCVGPYRVARWNTNEVVILERNEHYWGEKAKLKRVILRHVPERAAQRLMLEKGDIDVARLLNTDDLRALAKNKDVEVVTTVMHGYSYLAFNAQDPVFSNPKVRAAFRWMIDYQGLGTTVLEYQGAPRASLVPQGAFGALDEKEGQPFKLDLERAKALLAEAGYAGGMTKKFIHSANNISPQIAQHVQANAAKVGVTLQLEQMADAQLFTRARSRDFEVLLIGWGAGYPDADSMISRHAVNPDNRPEARLAQYPSWRSSWQDPAINAQADAARMERDPVKRVAMYHAIQKHMMENGPMAYIYQTVRPIAVRKEIKGFTITPFHVHYATAGK